MRSHCIQTVGFIIEGMKEQPDVVQADAINVSNMLIQLLNSGLKDSDPQVLAIQNTIS